jgi:rieske iron-sulfur protein
VAKPHLLESEPRRRVIRIAAAGVAAGFALSPPAALSRPVRGDRLVEDDADGPPTPLRASDLRPGKPLLAFPFDAATKVVRNDSRLNKVVLMRFPESELDAESKARAAGGVLAFSAICTHQACDVKTWLPKEKVLVCFCHASKFAPLEGAKVSAGPATRALPSLPLALEGDTLVIAGAFSGALGGNSS